MIALMFAIAALLLVRMAWTIQFNTNLIFAGVTYQSALTASGNLDVGASVSVPAAKVGQLTTRTNATDGTLTMNAGHGFTTAVLISLFWAGGSRRDVVVGTVSGNSVPITGGTGDDLPANLTNITAMVPASEVFVLTGDNCTGLLAAWIPSPGDGNAYVEFMSVAPAVLLAYELSGANPSTGWNGTGTNPLAGGSVVTVQFSHGQIAARSFVVESLYN